jgi:hypothetical protein
MPHISVKFDGRSLRGDQLDDVADDLVAIVARHWEEKPEFVSLEITPQSSFVRNRKTVAIEVDSSPDSDGLRASTAGVCAEELAQAVASRLAGMGLSGVNVNAWIRIFSVGEYRRVDVE